MGEYSYLQRHLQNAEHQMYCKLISSGTTPQYSYGVHHGAYRMFRRHHTEELIDMTLNLV